MTLDGNENTSAVGACTLPFIIGFYENDVIFCFLLFLYSIRINPVELTLTMVSFSSCR